MTERIPVQVLGEKLQEAGIPIHGVGYNPDGTFRVDYAPEATQAQKDQGTAIVAGFEAEEETDWVNVRLERDAKLYASDWTQVADAPLTTSQKKLWRDYRQALRDVPQSYSEPDRVIWPQPPSQIQLQQAMILENMPPLLGDIVIEETTL